MAAHFYSLFTFCSIASYSSIGSKVASDIVSVIAFIMIA